MDHIWNIGEADVCEQKYEVGSFENPVVCSAFGETVRQSDAIVGKADDDVPRIEMLDLSKISLDK